jgi:hypothetical protein
MPATMRQRLRFGKLLLIDPHQAMPIMRLLESEYLPYHTLTSQTTSPCLVFSDGLKCCPADYSQNIAETGRWATIEGGPSFAELRLGRILIATIGLSVVPPSFGQKRDCRTMMSTTQ